MSIAEIKELVDQLVELKKLKTEKKKEADIASANVTACEEKIIQFLEENELDKFVTKTGVVTKVEKMNVRVPQTTEQKHAFFNWLRENRGEDVANHYMTVNSQAINSLYNELLQEYSSRGEILEIDGLELPTHRTTLSLRKS